jgi:hypothetical protein
MGDLSKNFSRCEFSCQCGCGFDRIKPELVEQIQRFRNFLWISNGREVPVRICSGCRCPGHNEAIGGTRNSLHVQGNAADVLFEHFPVMVAGRMVYQANQLGFMKVGGLGVYPDRNFLHLDIRPPNSAGDAIFPVIWIKENGYYRYGVDFSREIDTIA